MNSEDLDEMPHDGGSWVMAVIWALYINGECKLNQLEPKGHQKKHFVCINQTNCIYHINPYKQP